MDTTEGIVDIDAVVMEAWKSKGIEAVRQEVFRKLVEAQGRLIHKLQQAGRHALRWGYAPRKGATGSRYQLEAATLYQRAAGACSCARSVRAASSRPVQL